MIPEVRIRIWTESGLASIDRQGGRTTKEGDQKTFSIFSPLNTSKKMFTKSRMTKTMMPPNRDGRLKMGKVLSIMAISLLSFPQRFLSFCFSDLFHSSLCYLYTQSNFFNTIQQIGKNTAINKLNRSENFLHC